MNYNITFNPFLSLFCLYHLKRFFSYHNVSQETMAAIKKKFSLIPSIFFIIFHLISGIFVSFFIPLISIALIFKQFNALMHNFIQNYDF